MGFYLDYPTGYPNRVNPSGYPVKPDPVGYPTTLPGCP